ncbi:putative prefoldin subunit 5 [Microstroma glucosiphilum]|uniref:Putative prefoldin subunit 5 n=1 Tax=Pseudomicrostroma glucosiphilum TaxID=1684307 RepID=A0A316TY56_9BASI|nr:putative prefoldin subunit 5 [Pseudomicrostroma glucosiphilum]PWN18236.1 putative prefoldin subunit 5 [Pseudomicrostroma glucosiphilum]
MSAQQQQQQQGQQVDVTSLSPSELLEVRQQLNQELEHLTASYGQLRSVQSRFKACVEALKSFTPSRASNPTLIPLTASLYVPGKLKNIENVIVDVGTGYYVEKSTADARKMYEEKIKYVGENLEKLQGTIEKKQDNLRVVGDVLQMKTAQSSQGRRAQEA